MKSRNQISIVLVVFVAVALAAVAVADSVTVTATSTSTGTGYSAPIQASGYLDRIEVVRDATLAASTNQNSTVVLATYDGTTALETFYTVTFSAGQTHKVARPRLIGQTTAGVNLAAATNATGVASTVLVAPYERAMIGGNLRLATSGDATNSTVTATIFFDRGR